MSFRKPKLILSVLILYIPNLVTYFFARDLDVSLPFINLNYLVLITAVCFFKGGISRAIISTIFSLIFLTSLLKIILLKFNLSGNLGFIVSQFNYISIGFILELYLKNMFSELSFLNSGGYYLSFALALSTVVSVVLSFLIRKFSLKRCFVYFTCSFLTLFLFNIMFGVKGAICTATILAVSFTFYIFFFLKKFQKSLPQLNFKDFLLVNILIFLVAFTIDRYNDKVFDYFLFQKNYFYKSAEFNFTGNAESSTKILFDKIESGEIEKYDNVVLIVVESLGAPKDDVLKNYLIRSFEDTDIKNNYDLTFSTNPFKGSTTSGEFRALCKKTFNGYYPKNTDKEKLRGCLPALFSKKGFDTYGIHNSNHWFYQRSMWYPNMQFQNILFAEDITKKYGLNSDCGSSFSGICEDKMFDIVLKDILKKPEKKFVYFLTVESHIPTYGNLNRNGFSQISAANKILDSDSQLKGMFEIFYNISYNVALLAKEFSGKKNIFIIVGDHKPPFTMKRESDLFENGVVPYFVLISK